MPKINKPPVLGDYSTIRTPEYNARVEQRDADVEFYKDYVLLPKEETIKKIESILAKYISDAKCQVFHSHDDVFLATQLYNELVKVSK